MKLLMAIMAACVTMVMEASAADVPMRRVLTCNGPDAKVEVYVPEAVISGRGVENAKLDRPVTGAYSLDLTEAGKGKDTRTGSRLLREGSQIGNHQPIHAQTAADIRLGRRCNGRLRPALCNRRKMRSVQ